MAKRKALIAPINLRVKAFFIDIFLLAMPFFVAMMVAFGSKDLTSKQEILITFIWIFYGIITSIFYTKSAQTPGYRANEIYLIDLRDGKKVTFLQALLRYIVFIIGAAFIIGLVLCFFRKDRLNLHDIITKTAPVKEKI